MSRRVYRFGWLGALVREEEGSSIVLFAIALPALLGVALLVVDIGRGNNLHLDLQNAADALAIAAARELDGASDAWTRAGRAITTLVENQQRFGDAGPALVSVAGTPNFDLSQPGWTPLATIPADDDDPVTSANFAATPGDTRFVLVRVPEVQYSPLFPVVASAQAGLHVAASAVAGFRSNICNAAPLFICNPYEGMNVTIEEAVEDPAIRRRMLTMRHKGSGAAWAPGNFGFIRPTDGDPGASALRLMFAAVRPKVCFSGSGITLSTGQQQAIRQGLNVRFDIYEGAMNGSSIKNSAAYRPARSVRKQYKKGSDNTGNACNASFTADTGYAHFPVDAGAINSRVGNGDWNCAAYWSTNFPQQTSGSTAPAPPPGCTSPATTSRYEVYRAEIDRGLTGHKSQGSATGSQNPNGEIGTPACYGGGANTLNDTPDRRLLHGAIINCLANADRMNGSQSGIPVEAYGRFFVLHPIENGCGGTSDCDSDIKAELVDLTEVSGNSILEQVQRDEVLLYR